jgi:excisionase family DNA binding protein
MEKLLTVRDAAERLGYTERTVRAMVTARKIPFLKIESTLRFRASELEEWVNARISDQVTAEELREGAAAE